MIDKDAGARRPPHAAHAVFMLVIDPCVPLVKEKGRGIRFRNTNHGGDRYVRGGIPTSGEVKKQLNDSRLGAPPGWRRDRQVRRYAYAEIGVTVGVPHQTRFPR